MEYAVRYLSKGGNTKKVAEAIADEINVKAETIQKRIEEKTDILFLGTAVYAFSIDPEMKKFVKELDNVNKVAIFSTSAIMKKTVFKKLSKLLKKKDISVFDDYYYTKGEYGKQNIGKPNEYDLKLAREFANNIIKGKR